MSRRVTPSVTDHALLRYLERVRGLDVEALKEEILTPGIVAAVKAGATAVKLNGITLVVANGRIVTVLPGTHRSKGSLGMNGVPA
jgi:hypothetical protein